LCNEIVLATLQNICSCWCALSYRRWGTAATVPLPFRLGDTALCGSHPLVTPYQCRLGDLLCFLYVCARIVFLCYLCIFVFLQYFDTVGILILLVGSPSQQFETRSGRVTGQSPELAFSPGFVFSVVIYKNKYR